MSILNNLEAMPNRIKAIAEIVAIQEKIGSDELFRRFVPKEEKKEQYTNFLREAFRMGILVENKEKNIITLNPNLSKNQVLNLVEFKKVCLSHLIQKNSIQFTGNEVFPRAIAWLLTRPIGPYLKARDEYKKYIVNDLNGNIDFDLTNYSRCDMLCYWAKFLGFIEMFAFDDNNKFCNPDPTNALYLIIKSVLEINQQIPIQKAIEKIGQYMPVFETGHFRTEIESKLKLPRQSNYISQSTSLALSRLKERGVIELNCLSDSPSLLLSTLDKTDRAISHITLIKI